MFKQVDTALALDTELAQQMQQLSELAEHSAELPPKIANSVSSQTTSVACSTPGQGSRVGSGHHASRADQAATPAAEKDSAEDLQPLAERLKQQMQLMHAQWRSALDAQAQAQTDQYRMGDQLRDAHEATYHAEQLLAQTQREHSKTMQQLEVSQVRLAAV